MIAVTAVDENDKLLPQANQGPHIALAAPGVNVLETAPRGHYDFTTGTSVAAAHVSGVAALHHRARSGDRRCRRWRISCSRPPRISERPGATNSLATASSIPIGRSTNWTRRSRSAAHPIGQGPRTTLLIGQRTPPPRRVPGRKIPPHSPPHPHRRQAPRRPPPPGPASLHRVAILSKAPRPRRLRSYRPPSRRPPGRHGQPLPSPSRRMRAPRTSTNRSRPKGNGRPVARMGCSATCAAPTWRNSFRSASTMRGSPASAGDGAKNTDTGTAHLREQVPRRIIAFRPSAMRLTRRPAGSTALRTEGSRTNYVNGTLET